MMMENKNHWYDGLFYDKVIAPNQDKAFRIVKSIIKEDSSVLDVGCGTGRLAFQLEDKCRRVVGVDFSIRNITLAKKNLSNKSSAKISFHHEDVKKFLQVKEHRFDYSVISFVIHEMDEDKREDILKILSEASGNIIAVDYLYPRTKNFWSILNGAIEFAAGSEHYRNFKSFIAGKGITGLAERTRLKIIKEIKNTPLTNHIIVLSKFS